MTAGSEEKMHSNERFTDYATPVLLSGGLAGALLDRGKTHSKATTLLQTALGVVLFAALLKWASEKKRRLLLVGFGATGLLGTVFVMLVYRLLRSGRKLA